MIHLRSVAWKRPPAASQAFPYSVPAIRTLKSLELPAAVTFFVGENGSGKSTLLEGIAAAAALPTVGASETADDHTLSAQRRLGHALRLTWAHRTHRGFFLRAEDFFGFQKRLAQQQLEMRQRIEEVDATYTGRSELGQALAQGPARASLGDIERRYGSNPDARSHGEAFLNLFQGRLVPGGFYLLDEPEAALSPQSQIGLLAIMLDMVRRDAQFLIATHSSILLAYPDAMIYSFDHVPVARARYDDLEQVKLTREFLRDPARFVARLGEAQP